MPGKILAVDDDPDQLELLDLLLGREGFAVDTAADGLAALDRVARCRPDLIVLDVSMPRMNGIAFCEKLQADPATAAIPILMLTGLRGHYAELNGLARGASAYLTKPYKSEEIDRHRAPIIAGTGGGADSSIGVRTARPLVSSFEHLTPGTSCPRPYG